MARQIIFITVSALSLLLSLNIRAYEISVEFSADAIQVAPGRSTLFSRMYVSKSAVRTEIIQQGQPVIHITYPKEGRRIIINPRQKKYIEQTDIPVSPSWSAKSGKTPCQGVENVSCNKLGQETLNEIDVEKWQMEQIVQGKKMKSLHWIDNKRGIAIKEMFPDGSVLELIMLGKSNLNGRDVEQWESRYTQPSGRSHTSKQWYDPELKMVIREEMEGGFLRELNNIRIGQQDINMFKIPKDYRNVTESKNSPDEPDK